MSDTAVQSNVFKEDLALAAGGTNAAEEGTRRTSTGGTKTLTKIDASHIMFRSWDGSIEDGSLYTCSNRTEIDTAVTAIGSDHATIYLRPTSITISTDLTIPANVTLSAPNGTTLAIATGITLTINGPFIAGLYQVFSCTGTGAVVFGAGTVDKVHPEWFGATRNGTTADTAAISSALTAVESGGKVYFSKGGSYAVTTLTAAKAMTITGPGTIAQLVAGQASAVLTLNADNITVDGLTITGQIEAGKESDDYLACIFLDKASTLTGITIKNCRLTGKQRGIASELAYVHASFALADLTIRDNYIRAVHFGIHVGPYAQNAVVNNNVQILNNDVQVATLATYADFENSRAIQAINTNNMLIQGNTALGGFSSIEVYSGDGTLPRPHAQNVKVLGNTCDSHLGFTQVNGGACQNNVIDMDLRDASWAAYDHADVISAWTYLSGLEAGDLLDCAVDGNIVRSPVGAGISQGTGTFYGGSLSNNHVYNSGDTASPPTYAHLINLDGLLDGVSIIGNTVQTSARSGIAQTQAASKRVLRTTIVGNTISACQQDGIYLEDADGVTIANNTIVTPNVVAGAYDGIRIHPTTNLVLRTTVTGNVINGGRYGISQDYTGPDMRAIYFADNLSHGATTAPYSIYGKVKGNRTTGTLPAALAIASNHIPSTDAIDIVSLDPGGADSITHIDGGMNGNIKSFYCVRADTTFVDGATLILAGSANVQPAATSVITFMCTTDANPVANVWVEVSRSIN